MDLSFIKNKLVLPLFALFLLAFFVPQSAHGYYRLCGGPCGTYYTCNSPYVCVGAICLQACSADNCGESRGCSRTCPCTSFAPLAPTNFRVTNTYTNDLPISVNFAWDFLGGTQTCGATGWGLNCSGNNNNFRIEDSGTPLTTTTTLTSASRVTTVNFTTWGNHPSVKVCASNDNFATKTCSSALSVTLTAPTPYPTIVISGSFKQKSSNSNVCYNATSQNYFTVTKLAVTPASPNCITPVCNSLPNSTTAYNFSCNITFDNVGCQTAPNYLRPTPGQNFTLSTTVKDYAQAGQWVDSSSTTCKTASPIVAIDATHPGTVSRGISFNYNSRWIKLKDSAFVKSISSTNYVPAIPKSYDADDDGSLNFIIGKAGSSLGLNIGSYAKFSATNNWGAVDYSPQAQKYKSTSSFLEYIKSKKEHQTITSINNVSTGINLIDADVEINNNNKSIFDGKNVVLFLLNNKKLTFNLTSFAPSGSVMFFATNIDIKGNVQTISNAIVLGDNINLLASTQGLKITGNLIAQKTISNNREVADNSKPSIFIVFNPKPYVDLLPYISSSIYDWKQIQ